MSALVLVLMFVGGWELYCRLSHVDPLVLPPPSDVASALWNHRSDLFGDFMTTFGEVALGLLAALVIGVAVSLFMARSRAVNRALGPIVIGSQAVPIPTVSPLLILVLGFGLVPKIAIVALVCFFPVTINLNDGLKAIDPEQRKLLRTLDATSLQTLRWLELPGALPQAFTGAKLAAAVSVIGAVFAEWAGSESGLGHYLLIAQGQLETAQAFACVVLLFALAIGLYALFAVAERLTVRWAPPSPHEKA